jgi:uncharacterized membrane protein YphA (DoxX/SURF4 family)
MVIDLTVSMILRLLLAYIFLRAALHKVSDLQRFVAQLDAYDLLPQRLLHRVAYLLIATECTLALTLPVPIWWLPPVVAATLLGVYALAIAINLLRGEDDLDCGCSGSADFPQGISWALVGRNAILVLAALFAAVSISERALSLHDAATIAFASIAVVLLYNSIGQVIANQQRQKLAREARAESTVGRA